MDAITLSMAEQAKSGDASVAVRDRPGGMTNTLVKAGMAAVLGSRTLAKRVLPAAAVGAPGAEARCGARCFC